MVTYICHERDNNVYKIHKEICNGRIETCELVTSEALLLTVYAVQHIEIDCGIEIWHIKLTCHSYNLASGIVRVLVDLIIISLPRVLKICNIP